MTPKEFMVYVSIIYSDFIGYAKYSTRFISGTLIGLLSSCTKGEVYNES
jgi:hypothetical protein